MNFKRRLDNTLQNALSLKKERKDEVLSHVEKKLGEGEIRGWV